MAFVLLIPLTACTGGETMPRAWGPLALAKGEECPAIAGRYVDSSAPIARMLAGRFIEIDDVNAVWQSFELSEPTETGFDVTVHFADGDERHGRARKGGPYSGDFYCEDGWLRVGDRDFPSTWDAEAHSAGFFPLRRAMRVAPGKGGALIARLDLTRYDEFTVWCGDGCKGFPLPWTFETRSSWSAAQRWDPDAPSPHAGASARDATRQGAARASTLDERLAREEEALENGPKVEGEDAMRARAQAALSPGMLLRAVSPRDSGWHLSLEFDDLTQLEHFLVGLSQSGPVAEIRMAPHYRARTPTGRLVDVVYVRDEGRH